MTWYERQPWGTRFADISKTELTLFLLPYLAQLPDKNTVNKFKSHYLKLCKAKEVDTYTHRLYAFVSK